MLDQARQVQGMEVQQASEEPLVRFFRRAGKAASQANTDLLEVRARLVTLASPEPEEQAVLHKLTLAQARVEIRRTVGRSRAAVEKLAR